MPRGVALVVACSTFPTWNGYPGIFASLVTGNPVIVKAHPTVKEAEVARNYWKLDKLLAGTKVRDGGQVGQGTSSDNFITRYCSRLGLPTVVSAAEHVASQASRYGLAGGRSPNVVATAAIYIVAHLLQVGNLPTMDEIAEVAQVRVSAVKQAYQAIRQPIDRLLPQDFQVRLSGGIQSLP